MYATVIQATTVAPDVTNPAPGNSGSITTASITYESLALNWTAGSDNVSAQATLQYLAYYSTSNNIDSVANCEANGTPVGSYAPNITTKGVTGLTSDTTYYFNVIVKDTAGNKAAYSTTSETTIASPYDLEVSGITDPFGANGYYIKQSSQTNGYDYYIHANGDYHIYNDEYAGRYWNIDNDTNDENDVLFYSTVPSTELSPVAVPNWSIWASGTSGTPFITVP